MYSIDRQQILYSVNTIRALNLRNLENLFESDKARYNDTSLSGVILFISIL